MLKATAKQHGIRLTGELVSCSGCSRAKGHRAPTPHHATRRATQPLGLVHIDTAGPYPTSLGGSRCVVIFVDSASRLQRPYGVREKSAAAILSVVKRFVADMGVPRAFRTDNGTQYSNSMFVDFCNGLGIRCEFTTPYTPQQNGPVESAISRAFKAGHAARLGVPQLYPDIHLEEIRGCTDAAGTSLWLESLLWASECYSRAATSVNDEWLSPHEIFDGSRPRLPLLPFLQPACHRVPRQRKTDPRAPYVLFPKFWVYSRAGLLPAPGCGDGEARLFGRRQLAPPGSTVDHHPDPGRANRTAEGHLRPHVAVCAHRRAISCTRRHSASSRTGSETTATAHANIKLPGSDPPAR